MLLKRMLLLLIFGGIVNECLASVPPTPTIPIVNRTKYRATVQYYRTSLEHIQGSNIPKQVCVTENIVPTTVMLEPRQSGTLSVNAVDDVCYAKVLLSGAGEQPFNGSLFIELGAPKGVSAIGGATNNFALPFDASQQKYQFVIRE